MKKPTNGETTLKDVVEALSAVVNGLDQLRRDMNSGFAGVSTSAWIVSSLASIDRW